MKNKKIKIKNIILFGIFLFFLILEIYLIIAWIPVKSAVKESDFYKHGNFNGRSSLVMQFNTNRASCNQESKIFTVYLWSKVIKIL